MSLRVDSLLESQWRSLAIEAQQVLLTLKTTVIGNHSGMQRMLI